MKLLIDMNLSPAWCDVFIQAGWQAVHWSTIGATDATDEAIMDWARTNGYIVFTHDLDFGTLLALTHARGPSVIQVRTQDVMPSALGEQVLRVLQTHQTILEQGALITIDPTRLRVRILPIAQSDEGRKTKDG